MWVEADIYLLDIRAFLEGEERGRLTEEAFARLDGERREKARRIRWERGQAESLGAGLLLQLAVRRAEAARAGESAGAVARFTAPGLLKELDTPLPLAYYYGENGKPYFKNYPYFFNLSHSGDYVACALSEREVGIDIQTHRKADMERLAGRFFSPAEAAAFRQAGDREAFFFRLWARKEAYGKLTGRGIADALGKDLWSGGTELAGRLCWEEYGEEAGYCMAVCQFFRKA